MSHRYVNLIYTKKDKQLTYKDVTIIKGGKKVKNDIAVQLLQELPSRLKIGTTYCLSTIKGYHSCTYRILIV